MNKKSLFLVFFAFALWGVLPLYWDIFHGVNAIFILACRIFFATITTLIVLAVKKRLPEVSATLRDKSKMKFLVPSAIVITINWGLYIWAIIAGHVLDASLGYYMNPLVVFAIGIALFHETSSVLDWVSLALATVGVLIATIAYGAFPWIAIVLALSFGLYGTFKKLAGVGGITSIAVETIMITPFALAFLLLSPASSASIAQLTPLTTTLLLLTGIVTASPLILFTYGVNRLPLSTVGFLQYSSPTLQMLIGVLVFHEVLTQDRIIAFAFIAAALVLYTIGMVQRAKKARLEA